MAKFCDNCGELFSGPFGYANHLPCIRPHMTRHTVARALHEALPVVTEATPPALTADELDEIHSAIGVAWNEGMVPDERAILLRDKVAALEAHLRRNS